MALPDIAWPLIGSLLAAPARRATRGWLATELWPENQDPEGARHRLGTSLWRMRSRFPDLPHLLDIAGDHIALAPNASIWVDVVAFARRAEAVCSRPGPLTEHAVRHRLARALACYRGDLLPIRGNETLSLERERLRALFADASYLLAEAEARGGHWREAAAVARRLCQVEPLREDAHRLLIRAHLALGDRAQAHRVLRQLTETLRSELGIEPLPETLDLLAACKSGTAPPFLLSRTDPGPELRSDPRPELRDSLLDMRERISAMIALLDRTA